MTPRTLDFSKPLPVYDEDSGEYLGYWMGPDGVRVESSQALSGEPSTLSHTD